jgi:hypothetical protein
MNMDGLAVRCLMHEEADGNILSRLPRVPTPRIPVEGPVRVLSDEEADREYIE